MWSNFQTGLISAQMIGVWFSWNVLNYTNDITCRDVHSAALFSQEWHRVGPPAQVVDADKNILFSIGANLLQFKILLQQKILVA